MSDFKFACPKCTQKISANDDYVGYQINCPSCQASIVVPSNPNAPAAPVTPSIAIPLAPGQPPPPAPPKQSKLGVSALAAESHAPAAAPAAATPHASGPALAPDEHGSAAYRALSARKPKKDYFNVIVSVIAIVVIGGAAYLNRDWLGKKWKAVRGPTAAEIAEANKPPPPPPELTAAEVMNKVFALYKSIPSYSSAGKFITDLDLSAVMPASMKGMAAQTVTADLSLKMSRPNNFRIDLTVAIPTMTGVTSNFQVTGWSAGNGYFHQANNIRTKVMSEDQLFSGFEGGVHVGVGEIVRLFNDESTDGLAKGDIEWTRNTDENVDGLACYVIAGAVNEQNFLLWVSRDTFLILKTQAKLDGISGIAAMNDDQIKAELKKQLGREPTLLETSTAKKMAKVTGTITDTYPNIQTNINLAAADFTPAAPVAAGRRGGPQNGQQTQPVGSRAAQIVGGRRRN